MIGKMMENLPHGLKNTLRTMRHPRAQVTNIMATMEIEDNHIHSFSSVVTFVDKMEFEAMYHLCNDDIQSHMLEGLMDEEENLPPFFHF